MAWLANLTITVTDEPGRMIRLDWNTNLLYSHNLYYNTNGGGWNFWQTLGTGVSTVADGPLAESVTYGYYIESGGDLSGEVYIQFSPTGTAYYDTVDEEITVSDSEGDILGATLTVVESLSVDDTPTTQVGFSNTVSESITVSDQEYSSSALKTDFAHFFGAESGNIYQIGPTYYSDDASYITSYWKSKDTDFSDVYPELSTKRKTVYQVQVSYIDHSTNTIINVAVSNDSGATWTGRSRTVGTGSGKQQVAFFHFMVTGQTLQFRIQSASNDKHFQITGMEAFFMPGQENFDV